MNEDVLFIGGFFFTAIVITLGLPLVRSYVRQKDRTPVVTPAERERDERLARMETAVEAMAVEIERISEGQRFVTRLLAERQAPAALPEGHHAPPGGQAARAPEPREERR